MKTSLPGWNVYSMAVLTNNRGEKINMEQLIDDRNQAFQEQVISGIQYRR